MIAYRQCKDTLTILFQVKIQKIQTQLIKDKDHNNNKINNQTQKENKQTNL